MKRINTGLYTMQKEVLVDGKTVAAEFRVFKIRAKDPKNIQKTIELPLWSWDCPKLNILTRDVHEKKFEAIKSMEDSCDIGFKTVPVSSVMLATEPIKK